MQLLENWDPLNLPRSSVRALVTLTLVGVLWSQMLLGRDIPFVYGSLVLLALGFGGVGYSLWRRGELTLSGDDRSMTLLFLVGALLAGFLLRALADLVSRGRPIPPRRWLENLKAIVVLLAVALRAVVTCLGIDEVANKNAAMIAAPVVGFNFGSRY